MNNPHYTIGEMNKNVAEISWASLWRVVFVVLLVAVAYLGRQILLGLFLAIVISSGLEYFVDLLERKGLPRTLGVILIFVLGALILVILIYTIIPFVIADLNSLFVSANRLAPGSWWSSLVDLKTSQSISAFSAQISKQFFSGNISPLGLLSGAVGSFGLAAAVLVSSFYLSLSRDGVERFIKMVFPASYEEMALRIYTRSRKQIGYWFKTQIILSMVMGILTWVTLTILGVKHAILLGALSAVFELVPFVGPILSGAAAVISALTSSVTLALYTLFIFLGIHQLESHVLVPLLTRRVIGLHPVVVIISLLIGIEVGGFLGAVIAVPAAAVFQEILEDWSRTKKPVPAAG